MSVKHPHWKKWLAIALSAYVLFVVSLFLILLSQSEKNPDVFAEFRNQSNLSVLDGLAASDVQPDQLLPMTIPSYSPWMGSANAPVTIIEFGDFQCPYCKASHAAISQLIQRYPNDVQYVWRHLPIKQLHPLADQLAQAAMCAHEQGAFWRAQQVFFDNQDVIKTVQDINKLMIGLGINAQRYNDCRSANRYVADIQQDVKDAAVLGARGTPTWIVNGHKIEGVIPLQVWEEILQAATR